MSASLPSGSDSEMPASVPVPDGTASATSASDLRGEDLPSRSLLGLALLAAALVAAIAWGLGESGVFQFRAAIADLNMMGHAYQGVSPQTRETAMLKGASCLLGTFGALLGMALGLIGGRAGGSLRVALLAAIVGLLAGTVAGALPVWIVIPAYNRAEELTAGDLGRSLLLHWGLWTGPGAAAGLALGKGLGNRRRILPALFGGIAGAVLGTLLYELAGGMFFPMAETGKPISETATTRLLALLCVSMCSSAGAVLGVTSLRRARVKPFRS